MTTDSKGNDRPLELSRRKALAGAAALGLSSALPADLALAQSSQPIRIAMSLGDIPRLWAGPDGGFEGMRFAGYPIFDPLIAWDLSSPDKTSGIIPGLATSWQQDPADRKRWIFKLRDGVTFHDGSKFDADAAVWNFASVFDEKAPQYFPARVGGIRARLSSVARAEKIDGQTIAIYSQVEDNLLPYQLSFLLFASPAHYAKLGNDWTKYAAEPSGTGPFKVKSVVPRASLELVRNEQYWDRARIAKAPGLILRPIPDGNARVAALRSGQVDFIEAVPSDAIPSLKSSGATITTNPYPHTWVWFFSCLPDSPFKDVRVRQAANLAIDRAAIVSMVNDTGIACQGAVLPGSPWFGNPSFKLRYDMEAAKKLVTEAGYGPNKPAKAKILISLSGGGQMQPQAMNEYIQAQLAMIGIQIEFQVIDFTNLFSYWRAGATAKDAQGTAGLNIALASLDPTSSFVRVFGSQYTSPRGTNWGHYSNPAVDAAIQEALLSRDQASLDRALSRAHEIIVDDAAALFVVHDLNPRAMFKDVKGFIHPKNWFADFTTMSRG